MSSTARVPLGGSLYAALRTHRPDVPPLELTKGTLVATSHLIEQLLAEQPEPGLLISGFQRGEHWAEEHRRYARIAGDHDVVAVFAGQEPPRGWGIDHVGIRLEPTDPLAQEWFVLALGGGFAVTLCGLDGEVDRQASALEADRRFSVIWSFDPDLAATALDVVLDGLDAVAPERATHVRDRVRALRRTSPISAGSLAAGADAMVSGLLGRVERLRAHSLSLSRQIVDELEAQRLELAVQLHDGPIQHLTAAQLSVELAELLLADPADAGARAALAEGARELRSAIATSRAVLEGMRPSLLPDTDLPALLHTLAADVGADAEVRVALPSGLIRTDPAAAGLVHRAASELVENVRRHADAALRLLEVTAEGEDIIVRVRDAGPGGCPTVSPPGHFGLSGLRHRAELRGGGLRVDSDDRGTTVDVRIPRSP
jgi:signal transduction histidine kinase